MAGKNIGYQRFCIRDKKGVLIGFPGNMGKIRIQYRSSVFSAETFIQSVSREDNAVVEILYQLTDFLHMSASVSTAYKPAARDKHPADLIAYSRNILAVKQYMVGNHQIKVAVFMSQNGTEATIAQLVSKCGYDARQLERDDQMLTIYSESVKAARKAHITLDWSAYKDMVVGLPYNIPFVVKNARAQIKCPRCGSINTARILYGMPAMDEELERKINAGKIYIGGCEPNQ